MRSVFIDIDDHKAYHLYPDLVTVNNETGEVELDVCHSCHNHMKSSEKTRPYFLATHDAPPSWSIASGMDFATPFKIPWLPKLGVVETVVLAQARTCGLIVKVVLPQGAFPSPFGSTCLHGHIITFHQHGPERLSEFRLSQRKKMFSVDCDLILENVQLVFVCENGGEDYLSAALLSSSILSVCHEKIDIWLRFLSVVNPYYAEYKYESHASRLDAQAVMQRLPSLLTDNARILSDPVYEELEVVGDYAKVRTDPFSNHLDADNTDEDAHPNTSGVPEWTRMYPPETINTPSVIFSHVQLMQAEDESDAGAVSAQLNALMQALWPEALRGTKTVLKVASSITLSKNEYLHGDPCDTPQKEEDITKMMFEDIQTGRKTCTVRSGKCLVCPYAEDFLTVTNGIDNVQVAVIGKHLRMRWCNIGDDILSGEGLDNGETGKIQLRRILFKLTGLWVGDDEYLWVLRFRPVIAPNAPGVASTPESTPPPVAVTATSCPKALDMLHVDRGEEPMSEIEHLDRILSMSFPVEFCLGLSLPPRPQRAALHAHLLKHHTKQFAGNKVLVLVLMNIAQRACVNIGMTALVKNKQHAIEWHGANINSAEFKLQVEYARDNPNTKEARNLFATLQPFITFIGKDVPLSPVKRQHLSSEMFAMSNRFGPPNVYTTANPSDASNPFTLRGSFATIVPDQFPATVNGPHGENFVDAMRGKNRQFPTYSFKDGVPACNLTPFDKIDLQRYAADNPVACASFFERSIHALVNIILKGSYGSSVRKSSSGISGDNITGATGKVRALLGVVEVNGRKSLHTHISEWGSIFSALLSQAAHCPALREKIRVVLDSQFLAEIPMEYHFKNMLAKTAGQFLPTSLFKRMPCDQGPPIDVLDGYNQSVIIIAPVAPFSRKPIEPIDRMQRLLSVYDVEVRLFELQPVILPILERNLLSWDTVITVLSAVFCPIDHDLFLKGDDDTVLHHWITTIKANVRQQPALDEFSIEADVRQQRALDEFSDVTHALLQVPDTKSTFRTLFLAVTMLDIDFISNLLRSEVITSYDEQLLEVFEDVGFDESFMHEAWKSIKTRAITVPATLARIKSVFKCAAKTRYDRLLTKPVKYPHLILRDYDTAKQNMLSLLRTHASSQPQTLTNTKEKWLTMNLPALILRKWQQARHVIHTPTVMSNDMLFADLTLVRALSIAPQRLNHTPGQQCSFIEEARMADSVFYVDDDGDIADEFFDCRQSTLASGNTGEGQPCALGPTRYSAYYSALFDQMTLTQMHNHTFTCEKGLKGQWMCRMCLPRSTCLATCGRLMCTIRDKTYHISERWLPDVRDFDNDDKPRKPMRVFSMDSTMEEQDEIVIWELQRRFVADGTYEQGMVLMSEINALVTTLEPKRRGKYPNQTFSKNEIKRIIKKLKKRNQRVVEVNPVLAAVMQCNTNAIFLGSSEQAKSVLFYLAKYFTKDHVAPSATLGIIADAFKYVQKHKSVAADAETEPDRRRMMLFLVRIINRMGGVIEVSDTQAASYLLGFSDYISSASCKARCYVHYLLKRALFFRRNGKEDGTVQFVSDDSENDNQHEDAHTSTSALADIRQDYNDFTQINDQSCCETIWDNVANSGEPRYPLGTEPEILHRGDGTGSLHGPQIELENIVHKVDPSHNFGTGKGTIKFTRMLDGATKPILPHDDYIFRGQDLKCLCLYEYQGIIEQGRTAPNKETGSRLPNGTFAYSRDHPYYEKPDRSQKIRSKFYTPVLSGPPPPKHPNTFEATAEWLQQADLCAAYMLVLFHPFESSTGPTVPLTWLSLCTYAETLRVSGAYFMRQRLATMENILHCNISNDNIRACLESYRFRNATRWGDNRNSSSDSSDDCRNRFDQGGVRTEEQDAAQRKALKSHDEARQSIQDMWSRSTLDKNLKKQQQNMEAVINSLCLPYVTGANKPEARAAGDIRPGPDTVVMGVTAKAMLAMHANLKQDVTAKEAKATVPIPETFNSWSTATDDPAVTVPIQLEPAQQQIHDEVVKFHTDMILHQSCPSVNARPHAPLLILQGPPGTGKTFCCIQIMKSVGDNMLRCALTGAAATIINKAETCHALFNINPMMSDEDWGRGICDDTSLNKWLALRAKMGIVGTTEENILALSTAKNIQNQSEVNTDNITTAALDNYEKEHQPVSKQHTFILLIDEVSLMSASLLARVSIACKLATGRNQDFGGLCVILSGDFYQNPPINKPSMYDTVMYQFLKNATAKEKTAMTAGKPRATGAHLLQLFCMRTLTTQKRSVDPDWTKLIDSLRQQNPFKPPVIEQLQHRVLKPTENFSDATYLTPTNLDRCVMNFKLAQEHAIKHDLPVIMYRLEATSSHRTPAFWTTLTDQQRRSIYKNIDYMPFLHGIFVQGAPCCIAGTGMNINAQKGLANGTMGTLHSLGFDIPTGSSVVQHLHRQDLEAIVSANGGECVMLHIVPTTINVCVHHNNHKIRWPFDSLVPDQPFGVIPYAAVMPISKQPKFNKKGFDHTSKDRIKFCVSAKDRVGKIEVHLPNVQIAFAMTIHKSQGATLSRVVLDLNSCPWMVMHQAYVGFTRVRHGCDFRLLAMRKNQSGLRSYKHLSKLGYGRNLFPWMAGYDNGNGAFQPTLVKQYLRLRAIEYAETMKDTNEVEVPVKRAKTIRFSKATVAPVKADSKATNAQKSSTINATQAAINTAKPANEHTHGKMSGKEDGDAYMTLLPELISGNKQVSGTVAPTVGHASVRRASRIGEDDNIEDNVTLLPSRIDSRKGLTSMFGEEKSMKLHKTALTSTSTVAPTVSQAMEIDRDETWPDPYNLRTRFLMPQEHLITTALQAMTNSEVIPSHVIWQVLPCPPNVNDDVLEGSDECIRYALKNSDDNLSESNLIARAYLDFPEENARGETLLSNLIKVLSVMEVYLRDGATLEQLLGFNATTLNRCVQLFLSVMITHDPYDAHVLAVCTAIQSVLHPSDVDMQWSNLVLIFESNRNVDDDHYDTLVLMNEFRVKYSTHNASREYLMNYTEQCTLHFFGSPLGHTDLASCFGYVTDAVVNGMINSLFPKVDVVVRNNIVCMSSIMWEYDLQRIANNIDNDNDDDTINVMDITAGIHDNQEAMHKEVHLKELFLANSFVGVPICVNTEELQHFYLCCMTFDTNQGLAFEIYDSYNGQPRVQIPHYKNIVVKLCDFVNRIVNSADVNHRINVSIKKVRDAVRYAHFLNSDLTEAFTMIPVTQQIEVECGIRVATSFATGTQRYITKHFLHDDILQPQIIWNREVLLNFVQNHSLYMKALTRKQRTRVGTGTCSKLPNIATEVARQESSNFLDTMMSKELARQENVINLQKRYTEDSGIDDAQALQILIDHEWDFENATEAYDRIYTQK